MRAFSRRGDRPRTRAIRPWALGVWALGFWALGGSTVGCGPVAVSGQDGSASTRDGATWGDGQARFDASIRRDAGPSGDALAGCNPRSFVLQQAPPAEVMLVVDRSGSMDEAGATPGMSKWDELNVAVDAALSQYEGAIRFGVLTYPVDDTCSTSGPQVGLEFSNRVPIMAHLSAAVPAGGTPTAAALNNASSSMRALGSPESPKFIVLATDGGPNCNYFLPTSPACSCSYASAEYCCTSYPAECVFGNTCLDDQHTLDVVTDLQQQGIETFVIGLEGTAEYVDLLNALAVAGGRPQTGGTTDYYPASNQADLLAALQVISVGLISCQIQLEEPPDLPELVRVYMDGAEIARDPGQQNGWEYTDSTVTVIQLYGDACDQLQDGSEHTLTATFACVVD